MAQEPSQLPDIKPDLNQKEESKKPGFFAHLASKFGGGSAATGGLGVGGGASSGLGGLFGAGGILATKAGIVGVLVVGTTVAGSVGFIGYKLLGSTSSGDFQDTGSVFHSRRASQAAEGAGGTDASGSSGSSASDSGVSGGLQFFVNANKSMKEAESDQGAVADGSADDSGSASASVADNDNAPGSSGPAPKLKGGKKIGGLSSALGGSNTGGTSSARSGAAPRNLLAKGKTGSGQSGAMSAGLKAGRGGRRGIGNLRRTGSAMKQLGGVRGDHRSARSSSQSGRTYDGGSTAGSTIGPTGGVPGGMAGQTSDVTGMDGGPPPNQPGIGEDQPRQVETPKDAGNVTPWQDQIDAAMMALMGTFLLMKLASMAIKKAVATAAAKPVSAGWLGVAKFLLIMAMVAAAVVLAKGFEIAGGEFGQTTQGNLLALAGGLLLISVGAMLKAVFEPIAAEAKAIKAQKETGYLTGTHEIVMYVSGGAALAAGAWAYMDAPEIYDCNEDANQKICADPPRGSKVDPGTGVSNQRKPGAPSSHVLDQYLAQENDHGQEQES